MRTAATIVGILWIAATVAGAIALFSLHLLRGGRGDMALLFVVALPGLLLIRWGRKNARAEIVLSRKDWIVKKPTRGEGNAGDRNGGKR